MLLSPIKLLIREFHFTVMQWQQIDVQESVHIYRLLRGSLPKSVPLDFGLAKTFASYFYHQHYYPS